MECVLSGNQIKCLHRTLVCLAKIGSELTIEARPDKLIFRTLNSSKSAFLSITFKVQFFDGYQVSGRLTQCSVLLKSACTVFRTSPGNMERLSIFLDEQNGSKLHWTLDCQNGVRKTYGICCNAEDELQDVLVDRNLMPSHLVVKPRDLTRLLGHFQSSLHEITFIATEPMSRPAGLEVVESKAVEMRSYMDPAKESTDGALHTQLWIDPAEELQEYSHTGVAVDVTFNVKDLKAFIAFCETSEVDMHMHFQKAGFPVVLAPKFGLDDSVHADFDATLVLSTCQTSQIRGSESSEQQTGSGYSAGQNRRSQNNSQDSAHINSNSRGSTPASFRDSDRTVIWSDLTGSAERTNEDQVRAASGDSAHLVHSLDGSEEIPFHLHRQQNNQGSCSSTPAARTLSSDAHYRTPMKSPAGSQGKHAPEQGVDSGNVAPPAAATAQPPHAESLQMTQNHASILPKSLGNWISGDLDGDDDDDETAEDDYCVQSTPPDRRGPT